MSSLMPEMFGILLNISSILHWNMLPTGTALKGSCLYWYWPNGHVNVDRYDEFSSNFKLQYPKLTFIIDIYFTLLNLGSMSFNVGPLWTGLINASFNLAGSKHNLTLQFAFGTNTKLLHHTAVSSTPSGVIMSSFCSWSNSSLHGFCSIYATHLGGAWFGLLSGLKLQWKCSFEAPNTLKNIIKHSVYFLVSSMLFLLSISMFGDDRK